MKTFKKSLTAAAVSIIAFSYICSAGIQPLTGNVNTVSAANSSVMQYGDDLFYISVDNDGDGTYDYADISRCNISTAELNIPDEIDGLPVKSIGIYSKAFLDCKSLTSITIPDSVTSIGMGSFSSCSSLENINVSENNDNYSSVDGVLFNKEKTELIAYSNANTKSEYTIPDSVTSIEGFAFCGCKDLESITIPESVASIKTHAFSGCMGLKSITIPNSVTSIESEAFRGCNLKSIIIPDSITSIENGTFMHCDSLTDVTIPDSVTSIGHTAFALCTALKNITIPESVTSIGDYAFSGCTGLTNITIKNPKCEISDGSGINDGDYSGVICGYKNSTAQEYAEKCGYAFEELDGEPPVITIPPVTEITEQTAITPVTTIEQTNTNLITTIAATKEPVIDTIVGDINADKQVNVADLVILNNFLVKENALIVDKNAADVNRDEKVNVFDEVKLKRILLNG